MKKNRLYISNNPIHTTWDCIFDNGTYTAFFIISTLGYFNGYDKLIEKSFIQQTNSTKTPISIILNKIWGTINNKIYWNGQSDNNQIIQQDSNGKNLYKNIFYFFYSNNDKLNLIDNKNIGLISIIKFCKIKF